jgi:hypothetical protein
MANVMDESEALLLIEDAVSDAIAIEIDRLQREDQERGPYFMVIDAKRNVKTRLVALLTKED